MVIEWWPSQEHRHAGLSIKIVPSKSQIAGVLAEFVADEKDAEPGSFDVEQGDLVSWNNTAPEEHWPWPVRRQNAPPAYRYRQAAQSLSPTA